MIEKKYFKLSLFIFIISIIALISTSYSLTFFSENQKIASGHLNAKAVSKTLNSKIKKLCNDSSVSYVKKYTGESQDSLDGHGTDDVCYYRGADAIDNGNVIFGDFCWQIVRTTDTGGVKLVYNGPQENNKCLSTRTVPTDSVIAASTIGRGSQSTSLSGVSAFGRNFTVSGTTFTITDTDNLPTSWSENDTNSNGIPDYKELIGTWTCKSGSTTSCTTIYYVGHYRSATNASTAEYKIGSAGHISQIGTSYYNTYNDSPALVGYMYNDVYIHKYKNMASSRITMLSSITLQQTHVYADNAIWGSPTAYTYNLTNNDNSTPSAINSEEYAANGYASLVGKYTFNSTSPTGTNARYIVAINNSTMYYINLTDSGTHDLSYFDTEYTFAESITDNGDDTYTLNNPYVVKKSEWYTKYNLADITTRKYLCEGNVTTCSRDDLKYITATTRTDFKYVNPITQNYTYAHDVIYNSSTNSYTLDINDYALKTGFIWDNIYNTLDNHHYTCFENYDSTNNSCGDTVYYIYYTNNSQANSQAHYITLKNGETIEDALKKMINYKENENDADASINQYDSSIKKIIDNWYKNNMTSLTSYLEDAVYCNDRSIYQNSVNSLGGWNKSHSTSSNYDLNYNYSNNNLTCANVTDQFTVGNTKAKLTYPVGLITEEEASLMGITYARTTQNWWLSAPHEFHDNSANLFIVFPSNCLGSSTVFLAYGARPSVSLASTVEITGYGTMDSPYIVKTN